MPKGPIVYFGSPDFAVPTLKSLADAGENISAVVTRPDTRRARGGAHLPSAVKAAALEMGLRVLEPRSMREPWFVDEIKSLRPEFLVVVAYGRILTREVLDIPSRGPVNLHASLLPRYRGAAPINWAVINGDTETGICTMLMSEGLDEGDVLLRESFRIGDDEDAHALAQRLSASGGNLMLRTLNALRDGSLKPSPQKGESSYARMLTKDDGLIDWARPAREIHNHVRGMQPWPGAFTSLKGKGMKVLKARLAQGSPNGSPGEIVFIGKECFTVRCGESSLDVLEVKPEGKPAMSAGAYARGHGLGVGMMLGDTQQINYNTAEECIRELYSCGNINQSPLQENDLEILARGIGRFVLEVDCESWKILKSEVKNRDFSKHQVYGLTVFMEVINEILAYCFFKRLGCRNLKFIKRAKTPTPDIEGVFNEKRILIEVKTINASKKDDEIVYGNTITIKSKDEEMVACDVKHEPDYLLKDILCAKLTEGLMQLKSYSKNRDDIFAIYMQVSLDSDNIPAKEKNLSEGKAYLDQSLVVLKSELGITNHCDIYLKGNCE